VTYPERVALDRARMQSWKKKLRRIGSEGDCEKRRESPYAYMFRPD